MPERSPEAAGFEESRTADVWSEGGSRAQGGNAILCFDSDDGIGMALTDCLGLSFLGMCNYDPNGPAITYFGIGEAVAALSVTLAIPQFLKPIYRLRLSLQPIRLRHIYYLVFLGSLCVLISAIIPNVGEPITPLLSYPVFWEFLAGVSFFVAFSALAVAYLTKAKLGRKDCERFVRTSADFLAHATPQDYSDFSEDLARSIVPAITRASFGEGRRPTTAFYDFIHRRELLDSAYASSFLLILSEPQLCRHLVSYQPWTVAAFLEKVAAADVYAHAAEGFIREIARQALIAPESMMAREVGYKGFRSAPVLTTALFANKRLHTRYEPLKFLSLSAERIDASVMERLNKATELALDIEFDSRDWWQPHIRTLDDSYRWIGYGLRDRLAKGEEVDSIISTFGFGLRSMVRKTNDFLATLPAPEKEPLYQDDRDRDFTLFDHVAECVYLALCSFANRFDDYDDPFWLVGLEVLDAAFPKIGDQPDGMNPFQQRLALKIMRKVDDNLRGFYPAMFKILLATGWPPKDNLLQKGNTASNILHRAFYSRLRDFPALYARNATKAKTFLPASVVYNAARKTLTRVYRDGRSKPVSIVSDEWQPISLSKDDVIQTV